MGDYTKGDLIRITATFTDSAGTLLDPTAVYFQYKNPAGTITSETYSPSSGNIIRDSIGVFHLDINANVHGIWYYRVYSTGVGQAADEATFEIADSWFD